MEQDRLEEYKEALDEASIYPPELNGMEFRLRQRIHRKKIRTCMKGFASFAAIFLLFVILVNSSTAMADELFDIPIIGTLAEYVQFDKGLQNAIKNEYAQEVNLAEQNNGYTLGIPYVIADSNRLVLFFQIPENAIRNENDYIHVYTDKIIDTATGKEYEDYTGESNYPTDQAKKSRLNYTSIRSMNMPIPQDLKIYVTMKRECFATDNDLKESQASDIYEPTSSNKVETLGSYVFDLHLEEYQEPKITLLNKDIDVKGQRIHIDSITEYPTGTEIRVNIPDDNEYIINGINFQAIDINGEEWNNPGGVISVGLAEDGEIIYYLEGNYLSSAILDRIQISGVRLIKRTESEITIDLQNKTMSPEIAEIHIQSIERAGNKAYITFVSYTNDGIGLFQHEYRDTEGNKYEFNSESASTMDDKMENNFAVVWPEDNKVILTRSMSPMIELEKPVEIKLEK